MTCSKGPQVGVETAAAASRNKPLYMGARSTRWATQAPWYIVFYVHDHFCFYTSWHNLFCISFRGFWRVVCLYLSINYSQISDRLAEALLGSSFPLPAVFFNAITHFTRPFGRQYPNIKLLKAHWHFDLRVPLLALSRSHLLCLCVLVLTLFSHDPLFYC